ncbi:MAG: type II toxin-antitoxin system VapC family toxin [Gemmatimonadota bacterium]
MKAIDTNVLVRFLVRDDARQAQGARRLIEGGPVWLTKTVLLETEWVLRYAYGLDRDAVAEALIKMCGLPQVVVEDPEAVVQALAWLGEGLDFADALHLASSQAAECFCTFDRRLIARAAKVGQVRVVGV